MKKLIFSILILLMASTAFAENFSELTTKTSGKPMKVIVVSISKDATTLRKYFL